MVFVDESCANADDKCHGHQLYADAQDCFEVVDGHVRGPSASPETKEKYTGISQYPC